jgi:hypothetical protein
MKSIATNRMPEVVSDLSYDFRKILESRNVLLLVDTTIEGASPSHARQE